MLSLHVLPTVSATVPNACPHCFPSHMQSHRGNDWLAFWPCNNARECPACRSNRIAWQIQKVHDGLPRSEWWEHALLDMDAPDYADSLRSLLRRLDSRGLWYASVATETESGRHRHIWHEPIPGWKSPRSVTVRGRKKTLRDIHRLMLSKSSRAVRFARASKSRPCWTKNTAERKRDADRRLPDEKHRLVVASPLGPKRFQLRAKNEIGRSVSHGDRLSPLDVSRLFVINQPPSQSKAAVSGWGVQEARLSQLGTGSWHSERAERRMGRESWRSSGTG